MLKKVLIGVLDKFKMIIIFLKPQNMIHVLHHLELFCGAIL